MATSGRFAAATWTQVTTRSKQRSRTCQYDAWDSNRHPCSTGGDIRTPLAFGVGMFPVSSPLNHTATSLSFIQGRREGALAPAADVSRRDDSFGACEVLVLGGLGGRLVRASGATGRSRASFESRAASEPGSRGTGDRTSHGDRRGSCRSSLPQRQVATSRSPVDCCHGTGSYSTLLRAVLGSQDRFPVSLEPDKRPSFPSPVLFTRLSGFNRTPQLQA